MVLNFKKLELSDKTLFDSYFEKYPGESSELTFTNLFVFSDTRKIEFTEFEGHLVISFSYIDSTEKNRRFFIPIGENSTKVMQKLFGLYPNASFERVEKNLIKNPELFNIIDDRVNYDYVYKLEGLASFAGKNYAPKRNFVNQFLKNNPKIEFINDKIIPLCKRPVEEWCRVNDCKNDKSIKWEYLAIKRALDNFEFLGLFGIAVFVGENVVGVAIGEKLNNETFVEHFEKVSDDYVGVYQFLLNAFAKSLPKEFIYINREQDLGIEGMRKSKLSYHPEYLVEKVIIKKK